LEKGDIAGRLPSPQRGEREEKAVITLQRHPNLRGEKKREGHFHSDLCRGKKEGGNTAISNWHLVEKEKIVFDYGKEKKRGEPSTSRRGKRGRGAHV